MKINFSVLFFYCLSLTLGLGFINMLIRVNFLCIYIYLKLKFIFKIPNIIMIVLFIL
jgi:hypothetical protein